MTSLLLSVQMSLEIATSCGNSEISTGSTCKTTEITPKLERQLIARVFWGIRFVRFTLGLERRSQKITLGFVFKLLL
ncbi:hypothetical protein WN51_06304 [Melipona quadrifasciata]|uniref:Uncharacterized protein n=1 Tax=Melipona quadrifasciata TaxID=166423 RepID=A0A0N0U397_9HYME|nr:hypothetical protein WN51_06304 [Melipona quadrifasciata]